VATLAATALAAGCAPRLRPPPAGLPPDPVALLAEVRAAQARVVRVQGQARVDLEGPEGASGVDQFVAAERPGRLRLETLDFFGNVLAVLAVDGDDLTLYDARQKIFYRGAATAENVGRLVPVALAPVELVTLLCGSAPILDGEAVDASPVDGALRLTLRRGEALQRLDVGEGGAILHALDSRSGVVGLEVTLTGHQRRGGVLLPGRVAARAPAARLALSLRWKSVEVNGPVDPGLFRLEPPAGARVVDLAPAAP
jgi:hypothetical protein